MASRQTFCSRFTSALLRAKAGFPHVPPLDEDKLFIVILAKNKLVSGTFKCDGACGRLLNVTSSVNAQTASGASQFQLGHEIFSIGFAAGGNKFCAILSAGGRSFQE